MSVELNKIEPKKNIVPKRDRRLANIKEAEAFQAIRMLKGWSRHEAARRCQVSRSSIEQVESGRCRVSIDRFKVLLNGMESSYEDFLKMIPKARQVIAKCTRQSQEGHEIIKRKRRNYYRRITKQVRVIRILRERSGHSQLQAARLCGYARAVFGHIENGRIELPDDRLRHIIKSLGHEWLDFERLMKCEVLRDELIQQCVNYLKNLDDTRLDSAATVIKALIK